MRNVQVEQNRFVYYVYLDNFLEINYNFKYGLLDSKKNVVSKGEGCDEDMEDSKIIQLFWERDESAIRETSRKFGSYCRSIAQGILKNHEDSEECVNEALMRAWESIPPKKPPSLCAYLGRITKNIALDSIRHSAREKRGGGELMQVYEELAEIISDGTSVEGALERKEMMSAVSRFLRKSPDINRRAFVLRYWYCRGVRDVARELGLKEDHAYVILSRMRVKLRNYLKKEGYEV